MEKPEPLEISFPHLARTDELVAERMNTDVSPEFRAYLEGFCQGMNAYAASHPKEVLNKRAFPVTIQEVLMSYPLKNCRIHGNGSNGRRNFRGKLL